MTDELEAILARVADGTLSADDAEALLAGPSEPAAAPIAEAVVPPRPPMAAPAPVPMSAGQAARAVRVVVTSDGREVVNLRIPVAMASLAGQVIPGLDADQATRLRDALRAGEVGTILDVRDDDGSGVRIATE